MRASTNKYEKWLGRVILIGVAVNIVNGLILIFAPTWYFNLLGFPAEQEPQVWVRHTGNILITIGLTYVPAALNPLRNLLLLAAALFARFLGVVFFTLIMIWLGTLAYWPILMVDGFFFVVPLWLFIKAFRADLDTKP
jgi:hypothetical protein